MTFSLPFLVRLAPKRFAHAPEAVRLEHRHLVYRAPRVVREYPAGEAPSCGGSPRKGARSALARGAATGGGGRAALPRPGTCEEPIECPTHGRLPCIAWRLASEDGRGVPRGAAGRTQGPRH